MTDKELVEFLFKEKDIARQEAFINVKAINQASLILLPFFFAAVGVMLESDKSKDFDGVKSLLESWRLILLLKIITQVLFLLWMYALSIVSNLYSLSGYIKAIEEKINYYSKHDITLWEGIIHEKYMLTGRSGQFISTIMWNLMYFILYVWIVGYLYNATGSTVFFIFNCVQMVCILVVFWLISSARKRTFHMTKLRPGKQVKYDD